MKKLWSPIKVGNMNLPHRLAMAPMTRNRAQEDGTPGDLAALYYSQRASLGLLITEGAQPSDDGQGYMLSPGIYTNDHIEGWKKVTEAVHDKGGFVYIQLMHAGRMSHPDNTPHHGQAVAPSAIAPGVQIPTVKGMQDVPVPRELSEDEIQTTIADFRKAAAAAIEAGADGVEIHGANGYLVHQFIAENANTRTDQYGGSAVNRARFAIEVAAAVADEIGADRTGFHISPGNLTYIGINEGEHGLDVYRHLIPELSKLNLAYLHVLHYGDSNDFLKEVRGLWSGSLLVNRYGRLLENIDIDLEAGLADVSPIGEWAIANPDFVERIKQGAPLNEADRTTYFGGGSKGYTDYPTLDK